MPSYGITYLCTRGPVHGFVGPLAWPAGMGPPAVQLPRLLPAAPAHPSPAATTAAR